MTGKVGPELLLASLKYFVAGGAMLFLGIGLYSVEGIKWYQPLPAFVLVPIFLGMGVFALRAYLRGGPK
jgi:hypothetical protein